MFQNLFKKLEPEIIQIKTITNHKREWGGNAFHFCRNYSYVRVWHKIYELLANIKDEEVEDFFVDYLTERDKSHPEIRNIIDCYFSV
jgi:hypothetical protein